MKAAIKIQMDNAAFTNEDSGHELARILRELADEVEYKRLKPGSHDCVLHDDNGNAVGEFKVRPR